MDSGTLWFGSRWIFEEIVKMLCLLVKFGCFNIDVFKKKKQQQQKHIENSHKFCKSQ